MAYRVLGQSRPGANAEAKLYEVAPASRAIASTFTACNFSAFTTTIRMRIAVGGAAADDKQYVYRDFEVGPAKDGPFIVTTPFALGAGDQMWVQSANGDVSFGLFGDETISA